MPKEDEDLKEGEDLEEKDDLTQEDDGVEIEASESDDPAELKKEIANLRKSLKQVIKESVKRKGTIRTLTAELKTLKEGAQTDDSALQTEVDRLTAENKKLLAKTRNTDISDAISTILDRGKVKLRSSQAHKDLLAVILPQVDGEWDDEDLKLNLPDLVTTELELRPYLLPEKKKAPDLDDKTNSKNEVVPEAVIAEVMRDFNIPIT